MANFNAVARTNYFRVRDLEAFRSDLKRHGITPYGWDDAQMGADFILDDAERNEPSGAIALFSYGPWPMMGEEIVVENLEPGQSCPRFEGDNQDECDVCEEPRPEHPEDGTLHESISELVSAHLVEQDVAVFMEVGFEKMRYLSGVTLAINHKGEIRTLDLNDIYGLAKSLGDSVTTATY